MLITRVDAVYKFSLLSYLELNFKLPLFINLKFPLPIFTKIINYEQIIGNLKY